MSTDELPMVEIQKFCQRWQVRELALFGSILRDDYGPESDVDVLVRFNDQSQWGLFEMALMIEELEQVFGRRVDLLTRRGVEAARNARRRASILASAKVVYVA